MTTDYTIKRGGWQYYGYGGGSGKGGKGARAPNETPDGLHSTAYARVLDIISEGEIHGLVNGLKSVYFDDTPLQNADNTFNFSNVSIDTRVGTIDQEYIQGFPASENTVPLEIEIKSSLAWVRGISNTELSAVRITISTPALSQIHTSGDITGYRIDYAVDLSTDGSAFSTVLNAALDGKTTTQYTRSHRIDLPKAKTGWQIRVRRITPNANSSAINDGFRLQSYTDIIDGKLRYPLWALVGVRIDASQFASVPKRVYHMRGRIIRVPANYDPETRRYSGTWDGTFKSAYSNNPAWVYYDMLTNNRYGLGSKIPVQMVDKWGLYQIAQYCDEFVPDGKGGKEPRFTCNVYLQKRADAWRVLSDLASVFRGVVYASGGSVVTVADLPKDPVYTYTNAKVLGGRFTYAGSSIRTRYTVALVSWNDPSDKGVAKVEAVEDQDGINRYGIRQTEVIAFGCTSQAQAHRLGKFILLTSRIETNSVTFSTGLEGSICAPGQIIRVSDQHVAGKRIGGLIHRGINRREIEIDSVLEVAPGDRVHVMLPNGVIETREVSTIIRGIALTVDTDRYSADSTRATADITVEGGSINNYLTADTHAFTADMTRLTVDRVGMPATTTIIRVTRPFSAVPQPEAQWTIENNTLTAQLFRVVSVTEGDGFTANIAAVQHQPQKYANVDHDTKIDLPPITVLPPAMQQTPTDVQLSSYNVIRQGVSFQTMRVSWAATRNAIEYEVHWRRDSGLWVSAGRTGATGIEVDNIYAGNYTARVKAISPTGVESAWAHSSVTTLDGIVGSPPSVTHLTASGIPFGIVVEWGIPSASNIVAKTELWYSFSSDKSTKVKLGDYAYPQNSFTLMGQAAGKELFFWARLVDKNGTIGDFYPTESGVRGAASTDPDIILDYLRDRITDTELSKQLLSKIEEGGGAKARIDKVEKDIGAMITLKTQMTKDGRTYIAGLGVGVEERPDGVVESQVLVVADRFGVLNVSDGVVTAPFVIEHGKVILRSAVIGRASIQSAMIADDIYSDAINDRGERVLHINMRQGYLRMNSSSYGRSFNLSSEGIRLTNNGVTFFEAVLT